jgi:outer membrane receptor protein involved in Fe transport
LAELSSLQSPVQRHVATLFGNLDITDRISLSTELFYGKSKSTEPFNQPIFNSGLFGGNSAAVQLSTSNPLLTPQARAAILAQPTPLPVDPRSPGDRLFFVQRASTDIGSNQTFSESDTLRGVADLEGDFDLLGREFNWNLAYNRGRTQGFFESPNIVQARFVQAIDVIRDPATGNAVCRDPAARAAGCAPLSLFGLGAPSQAALNYIQVQFRSDFEIDQTVYEANFGSGELFNLPGGPVGFNVGYEQRKEAGSFVPNEPQLTGVGRSAAISALSGEFETNEYYGEVTVPIFGDNFNFFGARRLEVDASYRAVDNSLAGEDEAYAVGIRWYPIDDLLIRGTSARSFRAPALTELFLPTATSFLSTPVDPCDFRNIGSGPSPANRTRNCQAAFQALGLPANFQLTSQIQLATVQGTTSGNQNLQNEIAEQWSAGFVYQPSYARGLAISFDWTDIVLTEAIFNFGIGSILQVCYDSPTPPADVCNLFQRGRSTTGERAGQVLGSGELPNYTGPQTGFVNAGYINFQGFTLGVDYTLDLEDITELAGLFGGNPGRVGFDFDLYHVNRQETSVTGLGFDLNDDKNEIGNADVQWKLESRYVRDPLSVIWTVNYTGESLFNTQFTPETRLPLEVEDYYIHDLAFTYDLASLLGDRLDSLTARLNIRNVGDVEPPFGTTGLGVYDVIGRFYQFGLTARF